MPEPGDEELSATAQERPRRSGRGRGHPGGAGLGFGGGDHLRRLRRERLAGRTPGDLPLHRRRLRPPLAGGVGRHPGRLLRPRHQHATPQLRRAEPHPPRRDDAGGDRGGDVDLVPTRSAQRAAVDRPIRDQERTTPARRGRDGATHADHGASAHHRRRPGTGGRRRLRRHARRVARGRIDVRPPRRARAACRRSAASATPPTTRRTGCWPRCRSMARSWATTSPSSPRPSKTSSAIAPTSTRPSTRIGSVRSPSSRSSCPTTPSVPWWCTGTTTVRSPSPTGPSSSPSPVPRPRPSSGPASPSPSSSTWSAANTCISSARRWRRRRHRATWPMRPSPVAGGRWAHSPQSCASRPPASAAWPAWPAAATRRSSPAPWCRIEGSHAGACFTRGLTVAAPASPPMAA